MPEVLKKQDLKVPLQKRSRIAYEWVPRGAHCVLDIGCGRGHLSYRLQEKTNMVVGIDIEKEGIKKSKSVYDGVLFCIGSIEDIPFSGERFEVVIMLDVLEHLQEEKRALMEVRRVLKPGGILIISVPHKGAFEFLDPSNFKFLLPRVWNFLWKVERALRGEQAYQSHVKHLEKHKHYSLEDMSSLLEGRFRITKVHRGGLFIYPLCFFITSRLLPAISLAMPLHSLLQRLSEWDYRVDYGRHSYNLVLAAQKL